MNVFSNIIVAYHSHNISNLSYKNNFEHHMNTQLQRYLLFTCITFKIFKKYSIYHKLNGSLDGFILIIINVFDIFS